MQFPGLQICIVSAARDGVRTHRHPHSCTWDGWYVHQASHLDKSEGLHDDNRVGLPARPSAPATCSAAINLCPVVPLPIYSTARRLLGEPTRHAMPRSFTNAWCMQYSIHCNGCPGRKLHPLQHNHTHDLTLCRLAASAMQQGRPLQKPLPALRPPRSQLLHAPPESMSVRDPRWANTPCCAAGHPPAPLIAPHMVSRS